MHYALRLQTSTERGHLLLRMCSRSNFSIFLVKCLAVLLLARATFAKPQVQLFILDNLIHCLAQHAAFSLSKVSFKKSYKSLKTFSHLLQVSNSTKVTSSQDRDKEVRQELFDVSHNILLLANSLIYCLDNFIELSIAKCSPTSGYQSCL